MAVFLRLLLCFFLMNCGAEASGISKAEQTSERTTDPPQFAEPQLDAGPNQVQENDEPDQDRTEQDGASDANTPPSAAGAGLPCDVAQVLSQHCTRCHGPVLQAPMPLLTYQDLTAPSLRDPSQPVYARIRERIHASDSPMPPTGTQDKLSAAELAVFDDWIAAGAPSNDRGCDAQAGDAGASRPAIDWSDCDYDFEIHAHGGTTPDDTSPYAVPQIDDQYECFNFQVPWDHEVDGLYFQSLIDDTRVVHHWSLTTIDEKLAPGSHTDGPCGQSLGRAPVAGWVPGAPDTTLPSDVGIRMADGTNATFQLEIHYNNTARLANVNDRTGVRVCATNKLRPNAAVAVTLGSPCFGTLCGGLPPGESTVSNTCISTSTVGPAHVLWTAPHMHKIGKHLTSIITRTDGTKTTLTDADFDFRDQQRYPSDLLINPGDLINTTCTFDNTTNHVVEFGESTSDEMCFNFLLVWPANSMGVLNAEGYCITPLPT